MVILPFYYRLHIFKFCTQLKFSIILSHSQFAATIVLDNSQFHCFLRNPNTPFLLNHNIIAQPNAVL